jgi:preprotein translocase SecE subunit
MSVAVKTPTGTASAGSRVSPALVSLVGVLFLLASLAIVFELIPTLWWGFWESFAGAESRFVGGTLLLVVDMAVAVALFVMGGWLLGADPQPGVRAGIAFGFLGLVGAVLLARWASLWFEYWAYNSPGNVESTYLIATAVVAVALLVGWAWLFTRPATHEWLVRAEGGGWFSTKAYKSNQGQRVRRATILGILLVIGAGIYTMLSHQVLARGGPDWVIDVPFTGKIAVDNDGDTRPFLAELPADKKREVQITAAGKGSRFRPGQIVGFAAYKEAVQAAVVGHDVPGFQKAATDEPTAFLMAVSKEIFDPKMREVLADKTLPDSMIRRLEGQYASTAYEGLGELVPVFEKELENTAKVSTLDDWQWQVPAAVLVLDRYTLRDENRKTDPAKYVKVVLLNDAKFTPDQIISKDPLIVSKDDFDAEVERIEKAGLGRLPPTSGTLVTASGRTNYASITLLPSIQFTVPLLLLAASIWFAWRVVNMPMFADFLIATEAELNKVSWTTQRRLVQDTIVVLITVVMMAVFLFGMDYTWKILLSWKPIGVLHIPKETGEKAKTSEQQRW